MNLHGVRRPSWRFQLLDRDNAPISDVPGVKGGSCEVAALSRLGWSGSIEVKHTGHEIDFMRHRVRAIYDPGVSGVDPWPVCTLLLSSPEEKFGADGLTFNVGLMSPLAVVDEDTTETTLSYPAGKNIIPTVVDLIRSTGERNIAVTDSDAVTRGPTMWPPGTPKLTIINELLEAAGYWSLWCDGSGMFRIEPYVPPAERSPAYEFAAGAAAVHTPDWGRVQDLASVPNRFVVVGQGDDEKPGLVGIAVNENPGSPFSIQNRGGRVITAVEEGVEVADQAAANLLAQKRLLDRMSPVAKLDVTHAILPLQPNDVVRFAPLDREPVSATVQRMSWNFEAMALCDAEWREAQSV
ncbi:hypothetical protein ICM05_09910 [Leucobacter sp. cx-42]|uniref:hypothetical protein n=1 Tax=unclassified Leucobacter TaxID=2621730 RepID=UPI00165E6A25|nr:MULTISPECIES: hypothetical protein [unclassified Leucobacter]MBC9954952.1 hypothetical protein [Leucobacter sp. cx-42]